MCGVNLERCINITLRSHYKIAAKIYGVLTYVDGEKTVSCACLLLSFKISYPVNQKH